MRVGNGRSAPWAIKTWEIGNEVGGWWTPGHTSNAPTFADSYVQFRDAMSAKDGSLEFIGEGGDGNSTDQTWNRTMIETAASKLDHLSTHYYPPQSLSQNYSSAAVYAASVGAPATIGDRLLASQNTILDYSDQDVKLAITEYSAMYFNEEHRRTRTLEAALQMAGHVNLFVRNAQVSEINFVSTLVNFWDGGGIRLGNRGSFVTPSHEVMRLFGNHHGPALVQADVTSTTYNADGHRQPSRPQRDSVLGCDLDAVAGREQALPVSGQSPPNEQPCDGRRAHELRQCGEHRHGVYAELR